MCHHSHNKEFLPNIQYKPTLFQFKDNPSSHMERGYPWRDVYTSVGHFFTLIALPNAQPGRQIPDFCAFSLSGWIWNPVSFSTYCAWMSSCLSMMWEHLIECNPWKIYSPDQLTCDFRLIKFQLLLKSIQPSSLSILLWVFQVCSLPQPRYGFPISLFCI